jgi:hypothetical protein
MPELLRWKGYRFFFSSLDIGEPPHVHVTKGSGYAKFWLDPVRLARSRSLRAHELAEIRRKIDQERQEFMEKWYGYFDTEN